LEVSIISILYLIIFIEILNWKLWQNFSIGIHNEYKIEHGFGIGLASLHMCPFVKVGRKRKENTSTQLIYPKPHLP
jgi:hypothetical protein